MRKKEQRRGGTTLLRVFLNQRAFFYDTAAGGRIFFFKEVLGKTKFSTSNSDGTTAMLRPNVLICLASNAENVLN